MTEQNHNLKITLYMCYLKTAYIVNCILFPPAKIVAIVWTVYACIALFPSNNVSLGQKIIIFLFGYLLFCGIADVIYASNKSRLLAYKMRNIEKRMKRLEKAMRMFGSYPSSENITPPTDSGTYDTNYDTMDGHEFEYFCADLLRKNSFINVEVTQGSGDHGIDILAEKDDITYAIQCKCYSSNIGNAAVQQAHTGKSLYQRDIAVVMTNRYFTNQAKDEATKLSVKLWDRDKLNELTL